MKKAFIILSLLIFIFPFATNAQYKVNKHYYDYRDYVPHYDDKYNPGLCGLASFAVPGLGQVLARETGRGIAFMGGSFASYFTMYTGAWMMSNSESIYSSNFKNGSVVFLGALAALIAVDIWATIDAVRVAKVNNMYINDLRKSSFRIQPSINTTPGGRIISGITLGLSF